MKLHFHPASTASRPVLLFCADNDIAYEPVVVDILTGEHYQEPFSKLNPNRLVPVLVDEDLVLTESSAILKYLAEKTGSPAYPKDLKARAKVNEAMDWFNTQLYREYGYHLAYPQVFAHHKREPDAINEGTVAWGKKQSEVWLGVLNDHLLGHGKKFVCGDQISIADYFGSAIVTVGELIQADFSKYPNVQRWLNAVKDRPTWNQVNEVFNGFAASLKDKTFTTIGA